MNDHLNIYLLWIQILRAKHQPGKLDERTNYKMSHLRTLSILLKFQIGGFEENRSSCVCCMTLPCCYLLARVKVKETIDFQNEVSSLGACAGKWFISPCFKVYLGNTCALGSVVTSEDRETNKIHVIMELRSLIRY